jgi:site-specific DNA-methyltransferase (adenine-specific)
MLTKRQKQILDFIKLRIKNKGYAPSLEEIAKHFKLSSVATVHEHIENLKEKGYLQKEENQPRAINVSTNQVMVTIPLLGTIAAGQPIEAIQYRETIAVPKSKLLSSPDIYALRVMGNSMVEENINDGDIVLVKPQGTAENGQKIVALIDNHEATLKKYYKEHGHIRLQPANKTMEPIIIRNGKDISIQGIVVDVIRSILTPQISPLPEISKSENLKEYITTYQDGKLELRQNDCIQFLKNLPTGSVDVIITDPAYSGMNNKLKLGKGRIVGTYAEKGKENGKWFSEFQDTEENYQLFLSECKRVLNKETGHIYIMFDSFSLLSLGPVVRQYFDVKNVLVWDKVNVGMGHYFRRRHEFVVFATNGNNRKINSRSFPDVWRVKRIHQAKYPTQKPVEVFDIMLAASAKPNYTVCDPFVGSGSAAIAAIKNKCNFIGCDISDKAFTLSKTRINSYINTGKDILETKGKQSVENSGNGQTTIWD